MTKKKAQKAKSPPPPKAKKQAIKKVTKVAKPKEIIKPQAKAPRKPRKDAVERKNPVALAKQFEWEEYFKWVIHEVLKRTAAGESLNHICEDNKNNGIAFPDEGLFRSWMATNDQLFTNYARAREAGYEKDADEIKRLADECGLSFEEIAKAKLQIESRKWLLSKRMPKKYGDKITVEGNADNPIAHTVVQVSKDHVIEATKLLEHEY